MSQYFLTRAWHPDAEPFRSVMDSPPSEAETLTTRFTIHKSDDVNYIGQRRLVEAWLKNGAVRSGVEILYPTPLYFRLTQVMETGSATLPEKIVSLPTAEVDLSCCSLTFDDSFCNYQYDATNGKDAFGVRHSLHGKVFGFDQADALIDRHGFLEDKSASLATPRYIEVQMWARPAFKL